MDNNSKIQHAEILKEDILCSRHEQIIVTPKVSVVMSVYNSSQYLRESIESILKQTFIDFEFIIWNDGSTDDSEYIIKSFSDPRIRYFYHTNTGLGQALNYACKEAKGEFIARMDSDDIALPNRLQLEYDYLVSNPSCVLVSSAVYYINALGDIIGQTFPYTSDAILKKCVFLSSGIAHPSSMFRSVDYFKTQGYPATRYAEDRILWSKLSKYGRFANLSEPLLKYRLLATSLSKKQDENDIYFKLRYRLLFKIVTDETYNAKDIEFINTLGLQIPIIPAQSYDYQISKVEQCYKFISIILGHKLSRRLIVYVKNFLGHVKYKI